MKKPISISLILRALLVIISLTATSIFLMLTTSGCVSLSSAHNFQMQWNKTYGGAEEDSAMSVIQSSDGGFAIGGGTYSFGAGEADFWLIKTDANGNVLWNRTYGGTERDGALSLIQTSDDGYAMVGYTGSFGAGYSCWDCWLVKTDANGNMQWNLQYGGESEDYGYSVVQTSDGGYAVAGQTLSFGAGSSDGWLIKIDADGNIEWFKTYGGAGWDGMYSLVQTSDGGYAMAGFTGTTLMEDFWLVKTDENGNVQWNLIFGGTGRDILRSLVQTSEGGYTATGYTSPFPWPGPFDACLVNIDANGILQWIKTYGEEEDEYANSFIQSNDGGYAVAGIIGSPDAGTSDFWIFKTDLSGNVRWNQTYGGTGRDEAYSLVQTSDKGYAIAGYTHSLGAGDFDCWLIKLAPIKILATININPDTLNLKSNGEWITCYIELPEGFNVGDINANTILLNGTVRVDFETSMQIGDYDNDGVPDLMVKFDRAEVISYILANVNMEQLLDERFMTVTLTVSGKLNDETPFEGSDTIIIIYNTPKGRVSS